jgi:outer membrane protein OmpA-like peptidoglycan-associated protein
MLKKSMVIAAISLLAATAASAHSLKPVRDFRGNFAEDFRGNCLRTKWATTTDECGFEPVAAPAPIPSMIQAQISYIDLVRQSIYFDIDKHNIDADDINRMNQVITEVNNSQGVQSVRFVGYADKFATYNYNQRLSSRRADAILGYFKTQGYFTSGNVASSYYGDTKPVTNCDPKLPKSQLIQCRATDRRVDIEVELIRQRTETVSPNDPRLQNRYNQQVVVPTQNLQPVQPAIYNQGAPVQQPAPLVAPQPSNAAPVTDSRGRVLPKSMQPGYRTPATSVVAPQAYAPQAAPQAQRYVAAPQAAPAQAPAAPQFAAYQPQPQPATQYAAPVSGNVVAAPFAAVEQADHSLAPIPQAYANPVPPLAGQPQPGYAAPQGIPPLAGQPIEADEL